MVGMGHIDWDLEAGGVFGLQVVIGVVVHRVVLLPVEALQVIVAIRGSEGLGLDGLPAAGAEGIPALAGRAGQSAVGHGFLRRASARSIARFGTA